MLVGTFLFIARCISRMSLDSFGQFLNDAGRITLLTAEEEIFLGKRVQAMLQLLEDKPKGPYGKVQAATLRRGQRAKERMVNANLRLVVTIARKYINKNQHSTVTIDDLVQEGSIGLMRAVDKFDPTRGYKFSTYAFWWIKQGITRYLHQRSRMIRLPHHLAEKLFQVNRATHHLCNTLGRRPTIDELAAELEMNRADFDLMMDRAAVVRSLDELVMDEGSALMDMVGDNQTNDQQLNDLHELMHLEGLHQALNQLEAKERDMLLMRYGLKGHHQHTYREIADNFGVSRERVRQYVERSQRKLRHYLLVNKAFAKPMPQPLYQPWTLAGAA